MKVDKKPKAFGRERKGKLCTACCCTFARDTFFRCRARILSLHARIFLHLSEICMHASINTTTLYYSLLLLDSLTTRLPLSASPLFSRISRTSQFFFRWICWEERKIRKRVSKDYVSTHDNLYELFQRIINERKKNLSSIFFPLTFSSCNTCTQQRTW